MPTSTVMWCLKLFVIRYLHYWTWTFLARATGPLFQLGLFLKNDDISQHNCNVLTNTCQLVQLFSRKSLRSLEKRSRPLLQNLLIQQPKQIFAVRNSIFCVEFQFKNMLLKKLIRCSYIPSPLKLVGHWNQTLVFVFFFVFLQVDEYMNCEDLAFNFLVSHITRQPPIKVTN